MVETFGVASRKTGDQTVPDPSHTYALEPWSYQTVCFNKSSRGGTWGQAISGQTTYTDLCCEEFDQNRKENYGFYILDSCTNPGACSVFIYGAMGVNLSPDPIA